MSVQAGVWNFDGGSASREILASISQATAQHGPDGEFMFLGSPAAMLYRPFHTTKESRFESQPCVSPRGYVIAWDGRLDNREELAAQLAERVGCRTSDLAIVIAAFERWGTECFPRLIGDWAISIWNPYQEELILARDYIGIRHLYYHSTGKRVIWCSLLAPLVSLGSPLTLNDEYIAGYLALYPEPHLTPYREIHSVPPGKFVSISQDTVSVHAYWEFQPRLRIRYKKDADYEEHFRHVFRQAVQRRLRSELPVLAELSGGLDSSSIVCMADRILGSEEQSTPRLDTITYHNSKEPNSGDLFYASKIEEYRGRAGHHIDLADYDPSYSLWSATSFAIPGGLEVRSAAEVERFNIMQKNEYRVVLSGIGGDELLGGIPNPRAQLADLILQLRFHKLARELFAWSLAKRWPWIHLLLQALAELAPASLRARFVQQAEVEPWVRETFANRWQIPVRRLGPRTGFGFWLPSRRSYAQTVVVMSWQMSARVPRRLGCEEIRYPYLDHDLINFILSIPSDQLLRPGERRSLMRRSLSTLLPREVAWRRTKGTTSQPFVSGFEQKQAEIEEILNGSIAARLGYIDEKWFRQDLRATRHGNCSNLVRTVRGIALELWLQQQVRHNLVAGVQRLPGVPEDSQNLGNISENTTGQRSSVATERFNSCERR